MTVHILFVCWGNICRSPMAEQIARTWYDRWKTDFPDNQTVEFDSAGVSNEEAGNPIDARAARTLQAHDYPVGNHRARRITAADIEASDLVIAAEGLHLDRIRRIVPDATNLHLISDFVADAPRGSDLPDPWYGGMLGFEDTLEAIEEAMPGLLEWIAANTQ